MNLTFRPRGIARGFSPASAPPIDAIAPPQQRAEALGRLSSAAAATVNVTSASVAPAPATPTDEVGRELVRTRHPVLGTMFTPRTKDRLSALNPPWTPEQIVDAFRQAESGDLQMQSALFEYM